MAARLLNGLALLVFLAAYSFAQDSSMSRPASAFKDSTLYVDRIMVRGNSHTKEFVILREMTLRPGSVITSEQMEYDKNRIYSLGLFNQVEMEVIPSAADSAALVVIVSERWYIYPYPIFGFKDRDWGKFFYGLGLIDMNFRGRNQKLNVSFTVGYDPSVNLSYRNPFLTEEGTYYLETRLATNVIRNKSLLAMVQGEDIKERHYSGSVTLGKRFGIAHTLWATAGYEIVKVSPYNSFTTLSTSGEDTYPTLAAGYTYDTRDVMEYANAGTLVRTSVTKYGFPSARVDIIRYAADVRSYIPMSSQTVVAARVMTNLAAAGPTPSYNRVYFGYDERIRGHFFDVREGESITGGSVELHYALFGPRYYTVDDLPPAFGVWRFGLVAAVFGDAGNVWFRSQPFALNSFEKGYGVGLDLLLPYSSVIRFEFALNEVRQGQFIVDFGSSF